MSKKERQGARKGDSWTWIAGTNEHTSTVEGFAPRRGKGLGEVEGRESLRLTDTDRQTLSEALLIQVKEPAAAKAGRPGMP